MALTSTNTTIPGSATHGLFGFVVAIWKGLIGFAEANDKVKRIQYLSSLSDKALAEQGLRREDIVHHVFGNTMYL